MARLLSSEVRQLLHNKFVVIMGDSIQRAVYKDLVLLLQKDRLLTYSQLRTKGELSFEQDKLVDGGQKAAMHNGITYREVREFCTDHHLVRFYFLTRVYSAYVQSVLEELQSHKHTPDVVVINSCLWDLFRYGKNPFSSYRQNLENLFRHLGQVLPESCLLVWNTAMPARKKITGAFLPPDKPFLTQKKEVIEGNFYSFVAASSHNFDVLDLHFHFRHAEEHRHDDGVHWNQRAHRHLSHLLLAHVADAWGVELPHRQPVRLWIKGGPARGRPGQRVERQPKTSRKQLTCPLPQSWPPPSHQGPLLPPPAPHLPPHLPPPQPLPIPCHPRMPSQFLFYPQDTNFSSDQPFQSGQFFENYFHSDSPSSTETGFFNFEADVMFDPHPPRPAFPIPYYQQQPAPVVHRGFPRSLPRGPYVPWKQPPRSFRRQARTHPETRPH